MTRIEVGITHEVLINGDKSWIRLAIADDYDLGDKLGRDLDDAVNALAQKVNDKLLDVVEATVETIKEYDNK